MAGTLNQSLQCTQDVFVGFQAPSPPVKGEHDGEKAVFPTVKEGAPRVLPQVPIIWILLQFLLERPALGVAPPWLNDPPPFYPGFLECLDGSDEQ